MSVLRSERSLPRIGTWLELASLTSGALLIWMSARRWDFESFTIPLSSAAWLVVGIPLAVWGGRNYLAGALGWLSWCLRPWGSRRYHVHFRREAYIYMLILLVTGLGAMLGGSNLLLLVFGLMAGPFVLGGQVTRTVLQRLGVTRQLPDFAIAGERFFVRVRLANKKPLVSAWMIVAADTVSNAHEEFQGKVLFTRVPPRGEREAMYEICPAHRGRYRFGPMRVICGFPLGLVERSFGLGETHELVVYPQIGRLSADWHASLRQGKEANERTVAPVGVTAEEFHRLREYRGGDNPRAIHWRTTARRNELMVREYQHLRDPDLSIVVDLWQPPRPSQSDLERVELAISFAATLCSEHASASGEVGVQLAVSGRNLWTSSDLGRAETLRPLLEQLALADAGASRHLPAALSAARQANDTQTRRVLVTTRPTRDALHDALHEANPENASVPLDGYQIVLADPQQLGSFLSLDASPRGGSA